MFSAGSGKGTQAARLRENASAASFVRHLLRQAVAHLGGAPLGRQAKPLIERGALVPDAAVGEMMGESTPRQDVGAWLRPNGFPRSFGQAKI